MIRQYPVHFLSDGRLLALVRDARGWTVQRDGEPLASYATNTASRREDAAVREIDPFATASAIYPDSLTVAETAPVAGWWERPSGSAGRWRIVRDGTPVDGIVCAAAWTRQPPVISADGRHIGYVCPTYDGGGTPQHPLLYVVFDGQRHGPYRDVWGLRPSDDGTRLGWAAITPTETSGEWTYYAEGRPVVGGFTEAWRPRLDPINQRLAWLGRKANGIRLGLDGRTHATVEEVLWGPKFSDAGHLTWVVRRGRNVVRLDIRPDGKP
jgi:hypothetical protein